MLAWRGRPRWALQHQASFRATAFVYVSGAIPKGAKDSFGVGVASVISSAFLSFSRLLLVLVWKHSRQTTRWLVWRQSEFEHELQTSPDAGREVQDRVTELFSGSLSDRPWKELFTALAASRYTRIGT